MKGDFNNTAKNAHNSETQLVYILGHGTKHEYNKTNVCLLIFRSTYMCI